MLRRLTETFTATHLVALFAIAVAAPSALYAVTTFTNVAVTDSGTGATAYVDAGRKVWTYDPIANYTRNPAYAVNIVDFANSSGSTHSIYTVPSGKVLLIRSVSWSDFQNTEGSNSYYYLSDAGGAFLYNTEGLHAVNDFSATFDPGLIVRAGALMGQYYGSSAASARVYIQGYLIPAAAVPAPATSAAAEQFVTTGNAKGGARPQ